MKRRGHFSTITDGIITGAAVLGLIIFIIPMFEGDDNSYTGLTGILALVSENLLAGLMLFLILILWITTLLNVLARIFDVNIRQWRTESLQTLTLPLALLGLGQRSTEQDTKRLGYWLAGILNGLLLLLPLVLGSGEITVTGGYLAMWLLAGTPVLLASFAYLPPVQRAITGGAVGGGRLQPIPGHGPSIVFVSGELQGASRRLVPNGSITIGRGQQDQFCLFRDQSAQPGHVQIVFDGRETVVLVNAPIYLNRKVTSPGRYPLGKKARLQVGMSIINYQGS